MSTSTDTPRSSTPGTGGDTWTTRHLDVIRVGVGSDRSVAEILGVSPSQVTRWRQGQTPDPLNADRLAALALVVEMLTRWLSTEVIEDWIRGPNEHLEGRSPAYLIERGQIADVLGAVEAMKGGIFA